MSGPQPVPRADDRGPGVVSRRVLLGSGLAVLGAVGGGVVGFVRTDAPREVVPDPVPPADVVAAIGRERDLLAVYDAALATPGASPVWTHIRGEHQAHLDALRALLPAGASSAASTGPAPSPGATAGATPGAAELVAAERGAADAATAACLAGNGTAAVLLACIAASEASHAAVLG